MTISGMCPVSKWKERLADPGSSLQEEFISLYGSADLIADPIALLKKCIDAFGRSFGEDREVFVVRSTGRINLLGMHVDHRGGSVNPIAIKETFFVVEPRDDDQVVLRDVNSDKFPEESFCIGKYLPVDVSVDDWDSWCHEELEKRKNDPFITFSNYVRAGVLYFQNLNRDDTGRFAPAFRGMNVMIGSSLPPAAGLSTSSSLVVAASEAILHINGIQFKPMEFCEHCGPAEWYVGTRGGFGDHAAIKMGRANAIVHITAFPFSLTVIPFPDGYRIVLADSKVEAKKQVGAKDGYNTPLASYAFGLWLVQKHYPQYADRIEHLRDINTRNLGVDDAEILRIVKSLPESATRDEVLKLLPEKEAEIRSVLRSHSDPADGYRIREVCMYGISECARSDLAVDLLSSGDIETFGRLITLHHDGDRVSRLRDREMVEAIKDYSDSRMDQLIADAESGDPALVWAEPGGYNVSVPGIDMLVDLAMEVDGVVGAGLVGAGLGGSMIALVKADSADAVVRKLTTDYYEAKGLPPSVEIVSAVGGAGILSCK